MKRLLNPGTVKVKAISKKPVTLKIIANSGFYIRLVSGKCY